jgi:hypothetical protein
VLRVGDALFAELGAQVAGQNTRVRTYYARTAQEVRPRVQQAERELAELRDAPVGTWRRRTPELERRFAELRDFVATARVD